MGISAIVSGTTAADAANLKQQAGIAIMRKSLDAEQAVALQLIQSIAAPGPSHLGSHVDIHA